MTKRVAVVIPYFQREAGILQRALRSVVAQDLPSDVELRVVVVDDASPHPATAELEAFAAPPGFRVKLLHRANGGPGAARNTALDSLQPEETEFVAFLDSDDTWAPNHIADALQAMGEGSDFYFCDHTRFDRSGTWFEELICARADQQNVALSLPLDGQTIFPNRAAISQAYAVEYLSQTSTVVYRLAITGRIRFDTELRGAGEDYLFWTTLSTRIRSAAISGSVNVHCGRGENIYFNAFDWRRPQAASRYGYLCLLYLKMRRLFPVGSVGLEQIETELERNTSLYAFLAARNILRGFVPEWSIAAAIARLDPVRVLALPVHAVHGLRMRGDLRRGNAIVASPSSPSGADRA